MKRLLNSGTALLAASLFAAPAYAGEKTAPKEDWFAAKYPEIAKYVTPILDARYRYEFVDQDGKREAKASTLRTRFGFETAEFHGISLLIEGENVGVIGNERYYTGANNMSSFAKVEDPDVTELNRLQLSLNVIPDTEVVVGRQLIDMGSERFIGSQDWRQNQTTYDGVTVANNSLPDTELRYAYISKQHNYLGHESGGNVQVKTHAVDVEYSGLSFTNITPYAYFIEDEDVATRSNVTAGLYLDGKNKLTDSLYLLHDLEYANQSDYENNTNNVDLDYYRVSAGLKWKGFGFKAGYDVSEGDGTTGLITHLADNHEFNGWEDKFSTIPADGLEDRFFELSYKVKCPEAWLSGLKFVTQYHDFEAERTGANYGNEWDFKLKKSITDHVNASLYYETYDADTFSKDTDKVIFQLGFAL